MAFDERMKQLRVDYAVAFGSEHGARVLDDLRKRFFDGEPYRPERPMDTANNLGRMAVVRWMNSMLGPEPDPLPAETIMEDE